MIDELRDAISAESNKDISARIEYLANELNQLYQTMPSSESQYAIGDVMNLLEFFQDNFNQLTNK
jgi:methyl-accepting chemotaxis protein